MKKLIFGTLIGITVLIVLLIVLWVNDSAPAGWVTYQNTELSFALQHPQEARVSVSSISPEATFTVEGPGWESEDSYDGIWFQVRKQQLQEISSVQSVAAERGLQVTETTLAGFPGYQYQLEEDEGIPVVTAVLISAEPGELFEVAYWLEDPNNQGYAQIVERMLASFEVREEGRVPFTAIIFGVIMLAGIIIGTGLLFISRPS